MKIWRAIFEALHTTLPTMLFLTLGYLVFAIGAMFLVEQRGLTYRLQVYGGVLADVGATEYLSIVGIAKSTTVLKTVAGGYSGVLGA